jgi:hypothetical protein
LLFARPQVLMRCAGEGELVFGSHQAWRDVDRTGPGSQPPISAGFRAAMAADGTV